MGFLTQLLQAIQILPAIIVGFEGIFGKGNGKTKKQKAIETFNFGINLTEAIAKKDIVDQAEFTAAIEQINDGVVRALNASLWHKNKA
jgi:hypothetical protein